MPKIRTIWIDDYGRWVVPLPANTEHNN